MATWLASEGNTASDVYLEPGTTFYYRVVALDSTGVELGSSLIVGASTLDVVPPTPSNFSVGGTGSANELRLVWWDNADYEDGSRSIAPPMARPMICLPWSART